MKSPQKCCSSRGKQSCSQIQYSRISQGLLFSLQKPQSVIGSVVFSPHFQSAGVETHSKSAPQFRLMVIEVASRQTSFCGWFMRYFMVFFLYSAVCTTQHCCLSEMRLYCTSTQFKLVKKYYLYCNVCVIILYTCSGTCTCCECDSCTTHWWSGRS